MIRFESFCETACFLNPQDNFLPTQQKLEIRKDPLCGHRSVYNPGLEGKTDILYPPTDSDYLERIAHESKAKCFLCEGRWAHTTPRYESALLPQGRLQRGDSVLFPNLFPLSAVHAVVMLGQAHVLRLDQFTPSLLADAFWLAIEFIKRSVAHDPAIDHFTINANYLPPAGASVIHPHMQILGSKQPGSHQALLLERSSQYIQQYKTGYFADLVEIEIEQQQRYIAQIGSGHWLCAFSPIGPHELMGVWPHTVDFLAWDQPEIEAAATGLSKALWAYAKLGLSTFNLSMFGQALRRPASGMCVVLRLVNRQNMMPDHRSDDYYFQKLLKNEIILRTPENLAGLCRTWFDQHCSALE